MMLKSSNGLLCRFPVIQSILTSLGCKENIYVSASLDRWYVHHLRSPRIFTPPKKPFTYDNDWENQPYKSKSQNEYMTNVESYKDFQSLDERLKNMFTYKYVRRRDEFEENLNTTLNELGFKPTDESLAAQVVRMTMELRYKKWRLREHTRCTTLKFATKSLIKTRWRTLRLLRATNASEFDRITSALNITGYQHVDPFQIPTEDPIVECKISVRAKYYQRRVVKLAEVKTSITSSEQQFYEQKNSTLSNLLEDLSSLVESNDSQAKKIGAEKLMKELFNEVVEERSLDVLSGPEKDRFSWYAKEAEKRQKLADSQARKAEKQQRKTRK